MEVKPEAYDNETLLGLLQGAFKDWKRAQNICVRQGDIYIRQNSYFDNAENLRDTYLSLLNEARKRDLSLSREELINSILYTESPRTRKQPKL
ncbi:MAG TPA: hypothetical protein VFD89_04895 [Clostridia bacterium]|nr:hypothetical protein [Clostridia bacterium]